MKKLIGFSAGVFAVTALALAQNGSTITLTSSLTRYDHHQNRSIAFATAQLVAAGKDIHEWKAINAYNFCEAFPFPGNNHSNTPSFPSTASGRPTAAAPTGAPTLSPIPTSTPMPTIAPVPCHWSVYVTTAYKFKECENGLAFIERSGYGQTVISVDEGETFAWNEEFSCDWAGGLGLTEKETITSPHRELILDRIQKHADQ